MIFDIKKFAIHDGPGIRTTVFFDGCPLDCHWCHNPECKAEGRGLYPGKPEAEIITEVLREIKKDQIFYDQSGGGVTFSGGEPMGHVEQLMTLLRQCHKEGIHTAVDTCGYAEFDDLERVVKLADLILFDLKLIDDDLHQKYTAVSNRQILGNLTKLTQQEVPLRIRLPLIPDITDTDSNLKSIAQFLVSISSTAPVDLLPYNLFGQSKYKKLGKSHPLARLMAQTHEQLNAMSEIFRASGFQVSV